MKEKVLIIIPAFNEEETVTRTIHELTTFSKYDYIVVNDGSTDRTGEILAKNGFNHLNLPVNLGIGGAVQTGYKYAYRNGYDYAIQLDADGQHNPNDLNKLVMDIKESGYDMVIGSRFVSKTGYKGSILRRFGIFYFQHILKWICNIHITDPTSGYRIVNRKLIKEFANEYPIDYPEVEVLAKLTSKDYRVKEITVEMSDRQGGRSSITPFKSLYYMLKVTLFSIIRSVF